MEYALHTSARTAPQTTTTSLQIGAILGVLHTSLRRCNSLTNCALSVCDLYGTIHTTAQIIELLENTAYYCAIRRNVKIITYNIEPETGGIMFCTCQIATEGNHIYSELLKPLSFQKHFIFTNTVIKPTFCIFATRYGILTNE